jgi:hypothetical protein
MFYRKNVGRGERAFRIAGGCLMILCGFFGLSGTVLGWVLAGSGIVTILTGMIGYCPACALVGKKTVE